MLKVWLTVWVLVPLLVSRERNASCVCGECWLEWADEAVSMSLAPCPSLSSQAWLLGAAWGGTVSMSLFNRLSADCDFKSRVLSTVRDNRKHFFLHEILEYHWSWEGRKLQLSHFLIPSFRGHEFCFITPSPQDSRATHLCDTVHSSGASWGSPRGSQGRAKENPYGVSSTPKRNRQHGPRGSVRDTTSRWVRSPAARKSIPGRGGVPAPGGGGRDARASCRYTCSLRTPHPDWGEEGEMQKVETFEQNMIQELTKLLYIKYVCLWVCVCECIPFNWGSRGHTEGLLQVELASSDGVCRLRQADAAISEELKTACWAGFLETETHNSYLHIDSWMFVGAKHDGVSDFKEELQKITQQNKY